MFEVQFAFSSLHYTRMFLQLPVKTREFFLKSVKYNVRMLWGLKVLHQGLHQHIFIKVLHQGLHQHIFIKVLHQGLHQHIFIKVLHQGLHQHIFIKVLHQGLHQHIFIKVLHQGLHQHIFIKSSTKAFFSQFCQALVGSLPELETMAAQL